MDRRGGLNKSQAQELEVITEAEDGTWKIWLETPSYQRLYVFNRSGETCYRRMDEAAVRLIKGRLLTQRWVKDSHSSNYRAYCLVNDKKERLVYVLVHRETAFELYFAHPKMRM